MFTLEMLNVRSETVLRGVTNILIGSKKERIRQHNDPSVLDGRVKNFMRDGKAIPIVAMWGAAKGYALSDVKGVDGWDALALRRMAEKREQVRREYSPGVEYTVIMEDVTEMLLNTRMTGLADWIADYRDGLSKLAACYGIKMITESSLVDIGRFAAEGREFGEQFLKYWHGGPAPKGWVGELDKEYFLQKVANSGEPVTDAIASVCAYLGLVLARQQWLPPGLKLGFYRYPEKLSMGGRLEWKVADHQPLTVVPWVHHCYTDMVPRRYPSDTFAVQWNVMFNMNRVQSENER